MKIVSVWNPKGGQGKSLIAINLAGACARLDMKPLVIDEDPQGTALLFHKGGNLPFEVVQGTPAEKPDADLVILDHTARDWALPRADTVIMPTKPTRSDVATYMDALEALKPEGKKIIPVVTDGDMRRTSEKNVCLALRKSGAFELKASGVYSRASEEYRTIFDEKLNTAYKINERRAEFESILTAVLGMETGNITDELKEVA